jgi:hypothetical protein
MIHDDDINKYKTLDKPTIEIENTVRRNILDNEHNLQ